MGRRKVDLTPPDAEFEPRSSPEKSRKSTENLRERLASFYGHEDEELVRAVKLREKWGNTLFSTTQSEVNEQINLNSQLEDGTLVNSSEKVADLSPQVYSPVSEHSQSPALFDCIVNDYLLKPHDIRHSQVSTVLNVGGSILSMDWQGSLLAVSVIPDQNPLNVQTTDLNSVASSFILVYEVENGIPKLKNTFESQCGACISVSWRPLADSTELLLVCTDGVGIINIATANSVHSRFELNSVSHTDIGSASCACWRNTSSIIVGCNTGFIAEYCLTTTNPTTPSYVVHVHNSAVARVCSGYPHLADRVLTSGVDGYLLMHDVRDLRPKEQSGTRLRLYAPCICFAPLADSFIAIQDFDTTRLVSARDPSSDSSASTLTRHETCTVTSCAASAGHPLVLSGAQDGSVHITNALRRTMVTSRKSRETHIDCAIWRLECSDRLGRFRYVDLLEAGPLKSTKANSYMPVFPAPVAITSCVWQPTGTWFAAGSAGGLVRFDNVDA